MIMYAVPPTDAAFREVKSWGCDYVHLYGMGMDVAKDQHFFDLAQKYHLKVAANLNGSKRVGVEGGLDAMRKYVQHFKSYPALGFWYLYDEPDNHKVKAADLEPFYKMLKEETPRVPVAVCHAWTTHWYTFKNVQDILMNDLYPVTGAAFPAAKLSNVTAFTKSALNNSETVIPVIQFFNWQGMAKPEEKELRGYPVKDLRYPNAVEMRYLCFSTIAQGVRGLAFYSYLRRTPPDPQWAETTAAPVLRQVRKFANAVLDQGTLQWRNADKETIISIWEVQNQSYMILVNATSQPRDIKAPVEKIQKADVVSWGNTRQTKVIIKDGTVTVQAKPWEVFIWKITQ